MNCFYSTRATIYQRIVDAFSLRAPRSEATPGHRSQSQVTGSRRSKSPLPLLLSLHFILTMHILEHTAAPHTTISTRKHAGAARQNRADRGSEILNLVVFVHELSKD